MRSGRGRSTSKMINVNEYKISHGTNVVTVNNQPVNSKNFLLPFDWMLTTTTFVLWDILWAMSINDIRKHLWFWTPSNYPQFGLIYNSRSLPSLIFC